MCVCVRANTAFLCVFRWKEWTGMNSCCIWVRAIIKQCESSGLNTYMDPQRESEYETQTYLYVKYKKWIFRYQISSYLTSFHSHFLLVELFSTILSLSSESDSTLIENHKWWERRKRGHKGGRQMGLSLLMTDKVGKQWIKDEFASRWIKWCINSQDGIVCTPLNMDGSSRPGAK